MDLKIFFILAVTWIQLVRAQDVCAASQPSFAAPARRISEQKCREYNWERKKADKCSPPATESENTLYPYLGAIGYEKEDKPIAFLCNAVLVSPKFAVTTAHCVKNSHSIPALVRFGIKNVKEDQSSKVDAKIVRTIVHPKYKAPKLAYDIGLIELESLALTRSVMPACLWSNAEVENNAIVKVPAWANTSRDDKLSNIVREMKVKIVDHETCSQKYSIFFNNHDKRLPRIEDHHICADDSIDEAPMIIGVAGAPIITEVPLDGSADVMPYAHALSSFGFSNKAGIGVYVKIPSFLDWIEDIVWG